MNAAKDMDDTEPAKKRRRCRGTEEPINEVIRQLVESVFSARKKVYHDSGIEVKCQPSLDLTCGIYAVVNILLNCQSTKCHADTPNSFLSIYADKVQALQDSDSESAFRAGGQLGAAEIVWLLEAINEGSDEGEISWQIKAAGQHAWEDVMIDSEEKANSWLNSLFSNERCIGAIINERSHYKSVVKGNADDAPESFYLIDSVGPKVSKISDFEKFHMKYKFQRKQIIAIFAK